MKYIVYVSQAEQPFQTDELSTLLKHSRARNEADDITGLLIYRFNPEYDRGNFVQVLEGPDDKIDDVWSRISGDNRHHTIVVLQEGAISSRMFGNWSMGFKNPDAVELSGFEGFADLGSDRFWSAISPEAVPNALDLLKSFYDGA